MSQKRTTELVARITGEIRDFETKLEVAKRQLTELGATGERSNERLALSSTSAAAAHERAGAQFARTTEKMARGVAAVTTALYAMEAEGSARVLAVGSAMGNLLEFMGPQGKLFSGASIAAASLVGVFMQAQEASAKATRAMIDDINKMQRAGDLAGLARRQQELYSGDPLNSSTAGLDLTGVDEQIKKGGIKALRVEIAALKKELRELPESIAPTGVILADASTAVVTLSDKRKELTDSLKRAESIEKNMVALHERTTKAVGEVTDAIVSQDAALTKQKGVEKSIKDLERLGREIEGLAGPLQRTGYSLTDAADKWYPALQKIGVGHEETLQAIADEEAALKAGADAYAAFVESRRRTAVANEAVAKAEKELMQATQGQLKLTEEQKSAIRENALEIDSRRRAIAAATGASVQATQETERGIAALEAEIEALKKGSEAYVAYQRERAMNDAEEAVRARARAEGKSPTSQEVMDAVAAAREAAGKLFDLQRAAAQLRVTLNDLGADRLAGQLAAIAESGVQIATSLGDAGRNLAAVMAVASPLFAGMDGLQGALQKRDASGQIIKGQSVGLFDALRGKNGGAAQAAAIGSSLQIVTAGIAIADSVFDIFGTRGRRKIEEMRKAAAEFQRALQDFAAAANPRTGAAAAIRDAQRQAVELAKQAAAAGGGTLKFEGTQVDSKTLREWKQELESAADAFLKLSPKLRDQLATTAKGFGDLADTLDELEAAARKQVLQNLEDLGVRRLIAAGMPEAAERLRVEIEQRRALAEASRDSTDVGQQYLAALRDIQMAEQLAAEASRRRAAIMQQIEDDDAILGGDANQRLQRRRVAMRSLFGGDVADQFEGLDFGTAEGLKAARAIVESIYRGMMSDGVIDELERPLLDWLKTMLGDVDNALSSLPEVLDPLAAKLEAFNVRISTFALSAAEQFEQLRQIFADDSAITSLVGGVDLGTEGARSALKSRIEGEIAAILADNDISETERPYLDALQQFLGIVNSAIDAATRALEEEAARAKAARDEQRQWAQNRIALFGLEGVDALDAQMQSFGAVFTELFKQFDASSLGGLEAAQSHLRAIYDELVGMTDEEVMQRFGMTRDEVVAAVLSTNNSLGTLVTSLQQTEEAAAAAARATAEFTDRVYTDYLRSSGRDKEADLRAAQKRRDDDLAEAAERGAGQDAIDWILKTYDNIVRQIEERYAAKVAEVQQAAVSGGGSGGVPSSDAESAPRPKARNTTVVGDFMMASELTAQSMAGLLNDIRYNTGREGAIADLLRSLGSGPSLSAMTFPAFPTRTAAGVGGGVVLHIEQITVTVGALNPQGMTPDDAGRALVDSVLATLGRRASDEVRFLGSAKYGGVR